MKNGLSHQLLYNPYMKRTDHMIQSILQFTGCIHLFQRHGCKKLCESGIHQPSITRENILARSRSVESAVAASEPVAVVHALKMAAYARSPSFSGIGIGSSRGEARYHQWRRNCALSRVPHSRWRSRPGKSSVLSSMYRRSALGVVDAPPATISRRSTRSTSSAMARTRSVDTASNIFPRRVEIGRVEIGRVGIAARRRYVVCIRVGSSNAANLVPDGMASTQSTGGTSAGGNRALSECCPTLEKLNQQGIDAELRCSTYMPDVGPGPLHLWVDYDIQDAHPRLRFG